MADQKKHPQHIVCIDTEYCLKFFKPGFNAITLDAFIQGVPATREVLKDGQIEVKHYHDDLASRVSLRERHRLEFDKNFLQPLNYVVIRQNKKVPMMSASGSVVLEDEAYFLPYYRVKGGGESRLFDKMSVGWGGHSDWNMVGWTEEGAIHYLDTARNNKIMELGQECIFRFIGTDQEYDASQIVGSHVTFKGFIYDPSDEVGQHHLALVWEANVPDSILIGSREDEQKIAAMVNRAELMAMKNSRADLYENWSNIVIDEICKDSWDYLGRPDLGELVKSYHQENSAKQKNSALSGSHHPACDVTHTEAGSWYLDHAGDRELLDFIGLFNAKAFASGWRHQQMRKALVGILMNEDPDEIIKLPMSAFSFEADGTVVISRSEPIERRNIEEPAIDWPTEESEQSEATPQKAEASDSLEALQSELGPK